MQCPVCEDWLLTDHVFCPKCCKKPGEPADWNKIRLFECGSAVCEGNPNKQSALSVNQKKKAICRHRSKKTKNPFVYYVPVEALICEYFNCGIAHNMLFTTEEEIVTLAKKASALNYHSVFLSENAKAIYAAFGLKNASEAVKGHLDEEKEYDVISDVETIVNDIAQIIPSVRGTIQ